MNQKEAEEAYLHHLKRTEDLINSMGDNPQKKNAFITNTYATLYEKNPIFLWFSLGTIVSGTVGKNIEASTKIMVYSLGQVEASKIVLNAFSEGNQAIFKNIVPLFLTYDAIGVEGIEQLSNSDFDNPFKKKGTLDAIKDYALLQEEQSKIASSLGLPINDSKVIEKLFANQSNLDLIHSLAKEIAIAEQSIAQEIYDDNLVDILLDPDFGWVGHQYKLDEINILDKSYVLFDYINNPADFDQRMAFAEMLLKAIEDGINNGELLNHQSQVRNMAEAALWMANPHTASNLIGDVNGTYWAQAADEHDAKVKESVLAFINDEPFVPQEPIISPIDASAQQDFTALFSGEHEIVKITVDPLDYFLAINPNYKVIAHNITELWNSQEYYRAPLYGGTAFWKPDLPYLSNGTYLALYTDGEYHYYQPQGEVRGITFPFMYDTTTGIPLTMPILDAIGHYDHTSTIETLYTNPEAFSTPSHINWYNPYWDQVVYEAQVEAASNYYKTLLSNSLKDFIAPDKSISYNNSMVQMELNIGDIIHDSSGNINFNSLIGSGSNTGTPSYDILITRMELANGIVFELNGQGQFSCTNCSQYSNIEQWENAANSMINHI